MTDSFHNVCRDFYVNQKLTLKMDLPWGRESVLELFDRLKASMPALQDLRRYEHEISLESAEDEQRNYSWVALRQTSLRSGSVNPADLGEAYRLHRLVLETAPWFLSIRPLDIDHLELVFGFDFEAEGNRDAIIFDALLTESPLGGLIEKGRDEPTDIQPFIGLSLDQEEGVQAFVEIKSRTKGLDVTPLRFPSEPISVFLTVRRTAPIARLEDLPAAMAALAGHAERLAEERVIPSVLVPIRNAILSR
ncbi:MAG: hypothetical protein K8R92_10705 [Planctomycetes bacterium]|nr:hypothetical protein [Planctomycetota bacterium]